VRVGLQRGEVPVLGKRDDPAPVVAAPGGDLCFSGDGAAYPGRRRHLGPIDLKLTGHTTAGADPND